MSSQKIYSFTDIIGVFAYKNSSKESSIVFGGSNSIGINQITISCLNDNTIHDVSVDGGIFVLPVLVNNGMIIIECQQTSDLNDFLLEWWNSLKNEANQKPHGIFTNWANAGMKIQRNSSDGITTIVHDITGISPQRRPDKTYAAQGGNVTWNLLAANIIDSSTK